MSVYAPTYCPGDPCDPCAPVLVDAILRATCAASITSPPFGLSPGDPYTSAVDPNPLLVYYNGETFAVTITHTVQGRSVSVSGESEPFYGYGRADIFIPFPDVTIKVNPNISLAVTSSASNGWDVFCIPAIYFP